MTNPFPVPHKKEWADLGPYRAQVNAATRAQEAAMAKKGRKGGKPKLFARSTDLSRDRRAQKRAAGSGRRVGLREPELRSVLAERATRNCSRRHSNSRGEDAEEGNAVMAQWRDDRSLMSVGRCVRGSCGRRRRPRLRGGVDAALVSWAASMLRRRVGLARDAWPGFIGSRHVRQGVTGFALDWTL